MEYNLSKLKGGELSDISIGSIQLRALNVKDVFTVGKMLGKTTRLMRLQIANITNIKENPMEIGLALFGSLLVEAEVDVKVWLADLAGLKVEEFEVMPPRTVLDVIEQLSQKEDLKSFFVQASALVSRVGLTL